MKIKLSEKYKNQFLTTVKGFTIRQDEIKDLDKGDKELLHYLNQGFLNVVKEGEMTIEEENEALKKRNAELETEVANLRQSEEPKEEPKVAEVVEKVEESTEEKNEEKTEDVTKKELFNL